jgi:hypothetical protein
MLFQIFPTNAGRVIAGPVVWAGAVLQRGALASAAADHTVSCMIKTTFIFLTNIPENNGRNRNLY